MSYFLQQDKNKNEERKKQFADESRPRAFSSCVEKNNGHFLLSSLLDELGVKDTIEILASVKQFQFSLYDMIAQLIYSRVISPCSKSKTASHVFPALFNSSPISEDQIYDGLEFASGNYRKYIKFFTCEYSRFYERSFGNVFFDCINYYFEIDAPCDDKQKGPSIENRHNPINRSGTAS